MDHVRAGYVHDNGLANWHNNFCVCRKQVLIFIVAVGRKVFLIQQEAIKGKLVVCVLVAPVPLVPGHFDMHFPFRDFLLIEQNRQRERTDKNQNQNWANRPGNFQRRVVCKCAWCWVCTAVETHHAKNQQTSHKHGDDCDDPQDHIVQRVDLTGKFGGSGLKAKALRLRLTNGFGGLRNGRRRKCCCHKAQECRENSHVSP
mmetsp:Transcript_23160/g.39594  ORF Transcript_23160/g.39594 Transcript_23160/m.39594 type:complete len:201 (-) Transcript_23160:550-1152(-)